MRTVILAMIVALLTWSATPSGLAWAQAPEVPAMEGPGGFDPSSEELIAAGIGALAGMGLAFLLLEGELLPPLELFGFTERTTYAFSAAVLGSVGTRLLFQSWRASFSQ